MAAYLSLRHKADGKLYSGAALVQVDEMLCAHMGVPVDPKHWFMGWMDWAGFSMAVRSDKPIADALSHHMQPNEVLGPPDPDALAVCQWFVDCFDNESYFNR